MSIVTPSYNSGRFLEQTIQSVLSQSYPHIEYIVKDGGSSDETETIVNRYRSRLRFIQSKDNGPAHGINQGVAMAQGSIVTWLGADDLYHRDSVATAVQLFASNRSAGVVYGGGVWIDEMGEELGRYPTTPFHIRALQRECIICQPASFLRRTLWTQLGGLREHLRAAFDYDLWMRCPAEQFIYTSSVLAFSRMHRNNISLRSKQRVFEEAMQLQQEHYRYIHPQWVFGYAAFRRDGRDQFFEPLKPSARLYLESLWEGLRMNRFNRLRYLADWLAPISGTFKRILRAR